MFEKFVYFVKYNNAAILVGVLFFIFGAAAFASETGQQVVGEKKVNITGIDNKLLIEADLDLFDMNYKIEKIEEDADKYYVTYSFIDLTSLNNVWQYQLVEKIKPVSKKLNKDLGVYLAEELKEEYDERINNLRRAKIRALLSGPEKRTEVTEYSGLIGKALDVTGKIFSGYEPVKKLELNSPESVKLRAQESEILASDADNLSEVYNDYIAENDPDLDNIFGLLDNCPNIYNPNQADFDENGIGDLCDSESEPAQVDDIDTSISDTPQTSDLESEEQVQIIDLETIAQESISEEDINESEVEESAEMSTE